MPRLPVLTAETAQHHPEWSSYVASVYHGPLRPGQRVDLNAFTFFYKDLQVNASPPALMPRRSEAERGPHALCRPSAEPALTRQR